MTTESSTDLFGFAPVEGREVIAGFDGGTITSDAEAQLRERPRQDRMAKCTGKSEQL
jgi:hypothetical protein